MLSASNMVEEHHVDSSCVIEGWGEFFNELWDVFGNEDSETEYGVSHEVRIVVKPRFLIVMAEKESELFASTNASVGVYCARIKGAEVGVSKTTVVDF